MIAGLSLSHVLLTLAGGLAVWLFQRLSAASASSPQPSASPSPAAQPAAPSQPPASSAASTPAGVQQQPSAQPQITSVASLEQALIQMAMAEIGAQLAGSLRSTVGGTVQSFLSGLLNQPSASSGGVQSAPAAAASPLSSPALAPRP